ncbi:MAG: DUF3800 domain-containing protein [Candidatus Pacebacteria bacterium]|nr:DUF3800 domain-containing protein [Candidatus Paceibacterota bacterium]
MNPKISILIDESGTLPDPKDKVIIMAAVGVNAREVLLSVLKKAKKSMRCDKKAKTISEIKFYKAGERTKAVYLKELSLANVNIFALIIEKNNQSIKDTPDNFALLVYILIKECLVFYQDAKIEEVIFDKHFQRREDLKKFNETLLKLLGETLSLKHLDSMDNPEINSADMVAGSLLWKYTGKNEKFYNLIRDKVISEQILNWKEAKTMIFASRNKKPHEPAQAPIR